jgi:hypothetical protein
MTSAVPGLSKLVKQWVVGQAFNAEEVMALRKLLRDAVTGVAEAYQGPALK